MAKRNPIDQIEFMRNLLAFLLVGAFIGAMAAFTLVAIPDENKDILTYMIGQLSGMAITVLGFYFVSKVGQDALDQKRSENTSKLTDLAHTAFEAGAAKVVAPADGEDVIRAGDQVRVEKEEGDQ